MAEPEKPLEDSDVSRGAQVAAGFVTFWLIFIATCVASFTAPNLVLFVHLAFVASLFLLGWHMRTKRGWVHFPRGLLIGFLTLIGLAVLGAGLCFAIVINMSW